MTKVNSHNQSLRTPLYMLPHHGAPEAKIHSAASNRANTPLFVLSFIFLTVVLSFQSWQQWQNARHAYDIDVERRLALETTVLEENYTLPDGRVIRYPHLRLNLHTQT